MRKLSTFFTSLIVGCVVEAVLCGAAVISIFSSKFGPCGPSGDFPWWLVFVHQPGVWLAEILLPDSLFLRLPIIIGITAVELGLAAYIAMLAVKKFHDKK